MSTILRRIPEQGVPGTYTLVWTEKETPPLQTVVDTEQIRNLQECEMYGIHVSGTKKYRTSILWRVR